MISATFSAQSNGLSERTGKDLKEILLRQDADANSLYRRSNISPNLQYQLAHAARNARIKRILSNFSPNMIENLDFEQTAPAPEEPSIDPSPSSVISEKFRMLGYFEAMNNDY